MSLDESCIYLDVSGLAPPEPMELALDTIQTLKPGCFVHLHHWREPLLLYERLARRGFSYDARVGPGDSCELFIWKNDDEKACRQAGLAADKFLE